MVVYLQFTITLGGIHSSLLLFNTCKLLDCKTVGFSLKISKEIGKACSKPHTPYGRVLSVFSLVLDLLFDCSRVLEYAQIRTVLQPSELPHQKQSGKRTWTILVKRSLKILEGSA